jgi:hypothetical protein
MKLPGVEGGEPADCPRYAGEAQWSYAGKDNSRVAVVCPGCGAFEVSKAEFDAVQSDTSVSEVSETTKPSHNRE